MDARPRSPEILERAPSAQTGFPNNLSHVHSYELEQTHTQT